MLKIQGVSKSYGGQSLFEKISLQMNPGERLGLVGRNGHGKSTLFRLILGEEEADEGSIGLPKNYRIGHLAQHLHFEKPTILEEACLGLPPGEEEMTYKAEMILFGLGFTQEDLTRAPSKFSGGYQIRLNLTKVLVSEPNLLLLDEPTNYLDIVSIRWITDFLRQWPGELILISHDRDFMDGVVTHSAAIHRKKLKRIAGGTEKLYAQILQDEEIHEKTRLNQEKKIRQENAFIDRFRAQASKASSVQSRIKRLEKMPSLEKLAHLDHLDFSFRYRPFHADRMMEWRGVSFHYDPQIPLIADLSFKVAAGDRIAVIGKNGRGKSTLLKLMAGEIRPLAGEIYSHPEARLGYFGQTNIDRLDPKKRVEEEISASNSELGLTAVRNICGTMMFSGDTAQKKISVLSGGERSRVLLGKILAEPCNLLLLDEPTNHLDMESIEALLESLEDFEGAVVIVTHSEMILKELATKLIVFRSSGPEVFLGTYEEFLERVGWEEEAGTAPAGKKKSGKKAERRVRSELSAERSKTLTPLKKEMEKLEAQIVTREQELAALQTALSDASGAAGKDFAALGRRAKELQAEIDSAFDRLASLHAEHEEKTRQFATLGEESKA